MAGITFSKGAGLNDSVFGKSAEPIFAMVEHSVEAFEAKSMLKEIFAFEKTKNYSEKFTSETELGGFEPTGEGGAYPQTGFQEGYSQVIEPETWKNKFAITQEMVEDSKFGKVKRPADAFALSYHRTREDYGAKLLMGGFTGSVVVAGKTYSAKGADQSNLFATSHPSKTGGCGVQSNLFDADISYDSVNYLQERMQNLTDDDGNILNVMPNTIIIPNKADAKEKVFNAIGCKGIPETSDNSFNYNYGMWNIIVWPYLNKYASLLSGLATGKNPMIMLDSDFNDANYGAIWLERIKLAVRSYVDENTDNNVWKGRARYQAGFNNWRAFGALYSGSGGSTF